MRTKLLSALLLASTALAGVASADPIIRDHRYQQVQPSYQLAQMRYQSQRYDRRYDRDRDRDRDRDGDRDRIRVQARPTWMPQVNYGFQVSASADAYTPYNYGQDPYVEGIARGEWMTLGSGLRLAYNQQSKVDVNLGGEPLSALELQATGGRNWISEVHVELMDGREIKLPVSRFVDVVHEPNMRLDLGASGRVGVRTVEIFGYSSGKGSFNVIGA